MSLVVAKFDRYDLINNPGLDTASFTIWFSGCDMHCDDCQNEVLWDKRRGTNYSVDDVVNLILCSSKRLNTKYVVLLGGEPLQQDRQELLSLCTALKSNGLKIWLYTGYEFCHIPNGILDNIHIVKCGRYIKELNSGGFPASGNQRVLIKSQDNTWDDVTNNYK